VHDSVVLTIKLRCCSLVLTDGLEETLKNLIRLHVLLVSFFVILIVDI